MTKTVQYVTKKRPTLKGEKRPTLNKEIPSGTGVYLMKDAKGSVIYVGKATNLKKRIAQYFGREAKDRYQIKFLMERVESIETVQTNNEKEALLLEHKLIQKHLPRYNIDLKDNKIFVRIKLTSSHSFPAISITRQIRKDSSDYFGPYVDTKACRNMADQIVRYFKLRTCSDREFLNRVRPCIQYDIKRCNAPCVGYVSKEQYEEQVGSAKLLLKGKGGELLKLFRLKMKTASEEFQYEEAARFRDLITDLKKSLEKQRVVRPGETDREIEKNSDEIPYSAIIGRPLQKKLRLPIIPHFIECADISNISGKFANGAIVCFVDGSPMKSRYRLFNIKHEEKPNDYAMIREVLERRFKLTELALPDLFLIDGGKGQLSITIKALKDLNIQIPVAAIAKIAGSHKKSSDEAQVFLPNRTNQVKFKKGDSRLLYLIKIRDEAHRFCIKHHRKRFAKSVVD